jgi:hypothetical protein
MNKLLAGSIAIAMFLIAGCGARGPKLASSAEDIAGTTWFSNFGGPLYIQFFEDGTMRGSSNRELVEDHPQAITKFWFEGTQLFFEATHQGGCDEDAPDAVGIYEVHLLENGNLRFVASEDECAGRATRFQGLVDGEITSEWEPVP